MYPVPVYLVTQQACNDRLWAFERVVGAFLEGFDDKEERSVQSKTDCERLCLLEAEFVCRSAEYDETLKVCRLSREDRRTQPSAFRRQPRISVDYLENQCVKRKRLLKKWINICLCFIEH